MFWLIYLRNLHNTLPKYALSREVCYIYLLCRRDYSTVPQLYLSLYWYVCSLYNGLCLDMFVYVIQYNCWLYFILGFLPYISPMYRLCFHCTVITFTFLLLRLLMLYLCLLRYFGALHTICSLVLLHLGKIVIHISCIWFLLPMFPSSFTCIHRSVLKYLCLN